MGEVTVGEAAEMLAVNRQRVDQLVREGRIRVVRTVSRIRLLSGHDVQRLRAEDRSPGRPRKKEPGA